MSSDRHYPPEKEPPYWAKTCRHCGRNFRGRGYSLYGSNACRQAAYRERLVTLGELNERNRVKPGHDRNNGKRSNKRTASPSAKAVVEFRKVAEALRSRRNGKGGAA